MAFKAITLNTPEADQAHIRAEDDAAIYESLIGSDKVLNIGGKMAATTISNNKIRITDGVAVVGGHVGRIAKGDYEDMTIENGVSGRKRNDLIVARFLAGSDGGADSYGLVVIKGTAGTAATDPVYVRGNLYNGDRQRDFPLYRVKIEGLSIVAVEQMFEVSQTIGELEKAVETLNSNSMTIVEQRLSTTDGFIKYSNGLLEQWGRVTVPGGSAGAGTVKVTLEESYLSDQYNIQATAIYPSATYPTFEVSAQMTTSNTFNLYTRQSSGSLITGVTVQWATKGIWK